MKHECEFMKESSRDNEFKLRYIEHLSEVSRNLSDIVEERARLIKRNNVELR